MKLAEKAVKTYTKASDISHKDDETYKTFGKNLNKSLRKGTGKQGKSQIKTACIWLQN